MASPEENIRQQYWPWWRFSLLGLNMLAVVLCVILSGNYLYGGSMMGCGGGSPCEQVLNSRWSTIGGVLPVSGLALGVYLAMLVTSFFIGHAIDPQIRKLAWKVMLILAGSVAGSALWFIIVQKWFIGNFCPYCMTLHITGLLLTVLIIRQAIKYNYSGDGPANNPATVENMSAPTQYRVLPLGVTGLIFIGLLMSGILAAGQMALTPKAVYLGGRSQDNLTDIDYKAAPMIGSPDAPHVVKLLFDYQCTHCQKIHFMLNEVVRRYAGKLSFALCPAPLNTQCNSYIPRDVDAFKNSCELTRIGLAVWLADREAFVAFENWMFTFESGDKWQPRSLEAVRTKALELVGQKKLNDAAGSDWIEQYMQTCVQIYGHTLQGGRGGIPRLVYGSQWVIPEPNNEDDLVMILQKALAVPKP